MNEFRAIGVVSDDIKDALKVKDIDDERRAYAKLKLALTNHTRNYDTNTWENKEYQLVFYAFGRTAQVVEKMAKPGTKLLIRAHAASVPSIKKDGTPLLDKDGNEVCQTHLIIDAFNGIEFC